MDPIVIAEVEEIDPAEEIRRIAMLPDAELGALAPMLSPELLQMAMELRDELTAKRAQALRDLVKRLEDEKLAPIIRAKRPIEARWAEDDRQYYGFDRRPEKKADRQGVPAESGSDEEAIPPALNLTAPRTNTWTARIVNMTCPGSALPGEIVPTPDPTLSQAAAVPVQGGEFNSPPSVPGQTAPPVQDSVERRAADAAFRMNRVIKDQFAECKLPREVRKASAFLCRWGVGVLAGPFQMRPKRVRFRQLSGPDGQPIYAPVLATEVKPIWRHVNPRHFFPEMVSDIADASYAFELMLLTQRELADLRDTPGFEAFREGFDKLLAKEYQPAVRGEIASSLTQWNSTSPCKEATESRLAVWRFFGYLDQKDMEVCGCDLEGYNAVPDTPPPLVEMWFCDGEMLRADTMIPEGTARLPYYVTSLFPVDDTMFGGGIPYAGRDAQASINTLWRAAQHNAVVTAGPQIGYQDGVAEPTDGDYRLRGPKTWRILDPAKNINDVLSALVIGNNAEQYIQLLQLRMQMFDEEINLPLIAQGQPDSATPTSSGLTMQMRAASVAILNVGQNCEDGWVTPLFESAYHHNMVHHPDPSIKGDFDCVSKLVSDSVMREIKAQNLLVLANMRKEDPDLNARINPDTFYPRLTTALEQDADLFLTETQLREKQANTPPPPPDPKILAIEAQQKQFELEMQWRQMDRQLDHQERMRELDIRDREAESRDRVAMLALQAKVADLADKHQITVTEMQQRLGLEMEREATKRAQIASSEAAKDRALGVQARVKAEELAQRDAENQLEVEVEAPNPRIA